jgi:hypothetical protein
MTFPKYDQSRKPRWQNRVSVFAVTKNQLLSFSHNLAIQYTLIINVLGPNRSSEEDHGGGAYFYTFQKLKSIHITRPYDTLNEKHKTNGLGE